ncbi:MAG: NUDIX hydrolase [Bacteroidetes bacterium]|nr:NUDIX hydrolase [Bacteroidota bacterium]
MAHRRRSSLPPWRTLEEHEVFHTRIFDLDAARRREDETGNEGEFYILRSPNWINVVAITTAGMLVLVDQFRHGTEHFELEIVGGIVNPDESSIDAALRELREETGYVVTAESHIECIGSVLPNPAFLDNRCDTILVTQVERRADVEFDEHENIAVVLEPITRMHELVRSGEITHSLVINAFYWYDLWRKNNKG